MQGVKKNEQNKKTISNRMLKKTLKNSSADQANIDDAICIFALRHNVDILEIDGFKISGKCEKFLTEKGLTIEYI